MFTTLFTGFVGGICAWFLTDYIAKPLQGFYNLRREITRCLVVYDKVSARAGRNRAGKLTALKPTPDENVRLAEAQTTFRDLGGQMRAFAHVDYYANKIVTWRGYDANEIARTLIALSNEISIASYTRYQIKERLQKLLRVRTDS